MINKKEINYKHRPRNLADQGKEQDSIKNRFIDLECGLVLFDFDHEMMNAQHLVTSAYVLKCVMRHDFVEAVIILNQLGQCRLLVNETEN